MNGVSDLRKNRRKGRNIPAPRHPVNPAPGDGDTEPTAVSVVDVEPSPVEPTAVSVVDVEPSPVEPSPVEPSPVEPSPVEPSPVEPSPVEPSPVEARILPNLDVDWTDPDNHIVKNARLSIPNSVVTRFRQFAELPGSAKHTEIILQAVHDSLSQLPELVLGRRPDEQQGGTFPFRRRTMVQTTTDDPKTGLYMRPNQGELDVLERIVTWVSNIIKEGHPARKDSDRSEVVTAALDAVLP